MNDSSNITLSTSWVRVRPRAEVVMALPKMLSRRSVALFSCSALSALTVGTGCSGAPSDDGAPPGEVAQSGDDLTKEAMLAAPNSPPVVTVTTVSVPIAATTIKATLPNLVLEWGDLWKYTKLAHGPRIVFTVPSDDGAFCDDTCAAALIERAASHGGKLTGTLTVTRRFVDAYHADGTCARAIGEMVTLDLRQAAHGIAPHLEKTYGFLTFTDIQGVSVEVAPITCSGGH